MKLSHSYELEQKVNQLLKTGGKRLLINLLIRSTFSRWTLLNLSSLRLENKGLNGSSLIGK